jgi:FkbM family methyltransferase
MAMEAILGVLSRARYPGKYRIFKTLHRMGLLSGAIHHNLGTYPFSVPADQYYFWRICGPLNYQIRRLERFSRILTEFQRGFVFFDLGADVGEVSMQMKRLCPLVQKIIAVEPNPNAFQYLRENLDVLDIPTQAIRAAVSNFNGAAKFSFLKCMGSDHSGHLDELGEEEVEVARLDSIYNGGDSDIAIKIDVEGEEKNVLDGAANTLATSRSVCLYLEIHPDIIGRTGVTADEIFKAAEQIRPFRWCLAEERFPQVDRSRAFFEQFSDEQQYDVIGIASPG